MIEKQCPDCDGTGSVGFAVDISDYCECYPCLGSGVIEVEINKVGSDMNG